MDDRDEEIEEEISKNFILFLRDGGKELCRKLIKMYHRRRNKR